MIRETREHAIRRQAAYYFEPERRTCCATCAYICPNYGQNKGRGRMYRCGRWGFRVSADGVCLNGYCPSDPKIYGLMAMKTRDCQLMLGMNLEEPTCAKTENGKTATI